jgi:ABC-type glycerol-3-phosphate transport system substrate-binding protein
MPTQQGAAPGATSMSGGWVLSVGSHAKDKQAALDYVALSMNKDNAKAYAIAAGQIAGRNDVAAAPEYLKANPTLRPTATGTGIVTPSPTSRSVTGSPPSPAPPTATVPSPAGSTNVAPPWSACAPASNAPPTLPTPHH